MKKKLLAVLLSGAMTAAALSGCGQNTDNTPADTGADTKTETKADAQEADEADSAEIGRAHV